MDGLIIVAVVDLLVVGIVLVVSGIVLGKRGRLRRASRWRTGQYGRGPLKSIALPVPGCWLVVKSRNLRAVQSALGVRDPRPCSWLEGFANVDRLFIAPPVNGWILVTGTGLPEPAKDVDACFRFLLDLSQKLGRVQFFSVDQESHSHAWAKARNGRILRAYAWAEGTLWRQGAKTWSETELGLKCFGYFEAPATTPAGARGIAAANASKVPLLAAQWGLDLAKLPEHFRLEEYGLTGNPAHRLQ
jgi:hypothetical protein